MKYYYEIALLKSPLGLLTYHYDKELQKGQQIQVQLRNRKLLTTAVVINKVPQPDFKTKVISEVTQYCYDTYMLKLSHFISQYYVCSLGEVLGLFVPFDNSITYKPKKVLFNDNITLSNKQQQGLEFCKNNKTALLFADTGSGKTQIYIKAIINHLKTGSQALLLMPEISLTPQMEHRLKEIFDSSVAIWHSKITKKKKQNILDGLLSGEIKIIAGARSALFLPYKKLGIIIVDEEHDSSYKSEQKPKINVKDLSIYISSVFGIQTILGSATPSISSFAKIPYFRLAQTYFDTSKQITFEDENLSLTPLIIDKLTQTLQNNNQAIVFLPTRANFKYQVCGDCGKSVECPFCSVSLSLHKNQKILKCHYCNYTQMIPQFCPSCKTGLIKNYRLGTQEVKEQLEAIFSDKVIATFDKDSVKNTTVLKKILKDFNNNKIDILVGTQMLSKGHDYHNVTLAVVLGIDSVLNMTSYKVREEALSLALQIAGRSGRNGKGEVLIQTKNKELFDKFMIQADYEAFLKEELEYRSDIYPPKIRMAKVVFSDKNGIKAQQTMEKYINQLSQYQDVELVGFKECSIFKIANKYRYEMVLRSHNTNQLLNFLHSIDSPLASIDMDSLH